MDVKKGCAQRLNDFPGGPTSRRFLLFPLEPLLGTFNTQSFGRCLRLRWCKTYFIQDESMSQWVVFVCLAISSYNWKFPSSSPVFVENIAYHLKALRVVFIFNKTTKLDTTNSKRNIWLFLLSSVELERAFLFKKHYLMHWIRFFKLIRDV